MKIFSRNKKKTADENCNHNDDNNNNNKENKEKVEGNNEGEKIEEGEKANEAIELIQVEDDDEEKFEFARYDCRLCLEVGTSRTCCKEFYCDQCFGKLISSKII